jgi:O-antigen ligase
MIAILIGYIWMFVHRPFEVWSVLGTLHVERIYMLAAIAYWLIAAPKRWPADPLHWAFLAFSGAVLVCWLASPWSGGEYSRLVIENYFKQLVFYVMLVTSIHREGDLKKVCLGFVAVMALYMAHSYKEFRAGRHGFRMGIPRMIGIDISMNDPNTFGATIVYALPLVAIVWACLPPSRKRLACVLGYVGLSGLCIISTGSRSAFTGLIGWCGLFVLRSRYRVRMLLLALIAAPLVWLLTPQHLQERYFTLIKPESGNALAQSSAEARTMGFWVGLDLWQAYPVTGCGPGGWRPATGRGIEAHNLYGQLIGEMGLLGILTFVPIVGLIWWHARSIKAAYRRHPEWDRDFLYALADAVGFALVLLLLEGWAGHSLFRYNWQWYGAFLIVARQCVRERQADSDAAADPAEPSADDPVPIEGAHRWISMPS